MNDSSSTRDLRKKYQALLAENENLREEVRRLNARLKGVTTAPPPERIPKDAPPAVTTGPAQAAGLPFPAEINNQSDVREKIELFLSLFRGRDDVYALRWENRRKGTAGYSPCCNNEWKDGICLKPRGKCSDCRHRAYVAFDEKTVEAHLRGIIIAGVYPLLLDETCRFLAIDLDAAEWREDAAALRRTASEHGIPLAIERSRSSSTNQTFNPLISDTESQKGYFPLR